MVAERNASRVLVIFGIVIQLIYNIFFIFLFVIYLIGIALVAVFDPLDPQLVMASNLMGSLALSILAGTIFFILWIIFLIKPSKLKIGLIITGIIAIILCGVLPGYFSYLLTGTPVPDIYTIIILLGAIPGLLALVAGLIAKETMVA
ncbi:MAG: hypothetical protein Q6364_00435 [Candidatus Hermodarchaeota archaeon]|nr:hypothetical protein [Candidatus Hermodarchaeota archaeon]